MQIDLGEAPIVIMVSPVVGFDACIVACVAQILISRG